MVFYLRKEAASEEAKRPEIRFEDFYIDLRRQDRAIRQQGGQQNKISKR